MIIKKSSRKMALGKIVLIRIRKYNTLLLRIFDSLTLNKLKNDSKNKFIRKHQ